MRLMARYDTEPFIRCSYKANHCDKLKTSKNGFYINCGRLGHARCGLQADHFSNSTYIYLVAPSAAFILHSKFINFKFID